MKIFFETLTKFKQHKSYPTAHNITMRPFSSFSIIVLVFALVSCERIKKKGDKVASMAKQRLVEKRDATIDKVIPTFNSDKSDTKYNKKRFAEFFGFAPTEDVSDIFCYDDQLGIDSKFQFSFKCNSRTKDRIVGNLKMSAENRPNNYSSGLWTIFPWWDSSKIVTLVPYSFKVENSYYRYFWFDDSTNTAFYIDFDM